MCGTEQKADRPSEGEGEKGICFSKAAANLRIFPTMSNFVQQQ